LRSVASLLRGNFAQSPLEFQRTAVTFIKGCEMTMRSARFLVGIFSITALWPDSIARANSVYEQHVVFDNTRGVGWYVHSAGEAVAPSRIELVNGKLPLETRVTHSPPNALRLSWTSAPGGDWRASVAMPDLWGTQPDFRGDALTFWVYSDGEIDAGSSPRIRLEDAKGVGNPAINLIGSLPRIPAKTWTKIVLPFADFKGTVRDTNGEKFDPRLFDRADGAQIDVVGQPQVR